MCFFVLNFLFILYNIYLFTFVFKICLFIIILVPVMCNLFPKRGMLYLKLNRRKLHDDKKKSNVFSIGDHIYPLGKTLSNQIRLDKSCAG